MVKIKELIEQAAGLYIDLTDDDVKPEDVPIGKEVEAKQKQTVEILTNVAKVLDDVDNFIKQGKKVVKENEGIFATSFAEPYFDDFFNVLLLDTYKKKIIDKKKFEKLKKQYKEKDIDMYI